MMRAGSVLVTGASTGIGYACATRFAQLGYRVLAGVRKDSDGEALRALAPRNILPVLLDVTNEALIDGAVATAGDEPFVGLINNAGIATVGPIELLSVEAWRRQLEVNVVGLVAVTRAFLPLLRRSQGRIVNIGSIAGRSALPGSGAYDASKFAVEAITDVLRMELRGWGIVVSLIEAGAVATPIWEKSLRGADHLRNCVSQEKYALYERLMTKVREESTTSARHAVHVSKVVEVVEHAMTARRPKTRYAVGWDARLWLLLNLLPDRCRDWLILRKINS
jgi:NAD(P)-dependent dehydrogenase (short-subunit alcohol dehydrogenase family)